MSPRNVWINLGTTQGKHSFVYDFNFQVTNVYSYKDAKFLIFNIVFQDPFVQANSAVCALTPFRI